jgi:hypothetical protein
LNRAIFLGNIIFPTQKQQVVEIFISAVIDKNKKVVGFENIN